MPDTDISILEIGRRLKAFRLGAGITPEQLANQIGISRAAIYRYEAGATPRVDTLVLIAKHLGVTLPNLLGIGTEYISSAVSFFERMRQLEGDVDQMQVLFGPISYLLTTDEYDRILPLVLDESIPHDAPMRDTSVRDIAILMGLLKERKRIFHLRQPAILSIVSMSELEQFARIGFVGSYGLTQLDTHDRRAAARHEIENIIRLLRHSPIGVQIGLIVDSMPGGSFELFKRGDHTSVGVSPFRLGTLPNIRMGVATITDAPEAVQLYRDLTEKLWARSAKGNEAADLLERNIIARYF